MKNIISIVIFFFCSLIFAQSSISISKSLSFDFNENSVSMLGEYPISETNNLTISLLDYSFVEEEQVNVTFLFISALTDQEFYSRKEGKNVNSEFNGSIVLEYYTIIELKELIENIYLNRKRQNFSTSNDLGYINYELTNGIVSIYISSDFVPEIYNNNLLGRYKNVESIIFKLNADQIKQFRKFLKSFY